MAGTQMEVLTYAVLWPGELSSGDVAYQIGKRPGAVGMAATRLRQAGYLAESPAAMSIAKLEPTTAGVHYYAAHAILDYDERLALQRAYAAVAVPGEPSLDEPEPVDDDATAPEEPRPMPEPDEDEHV